VIDGSPRSHPPAPPRLAKAVPDVIPDAVYVEVRTRHYVGVPTPDIIFDRINVFLRTRWSLLLIAMIPLWRSLLDLLSNQVTLHSIQDQFGGLIVNGTLHRDHAGRLVGR